MAKKPVRLPYRCLSRAAHKLNSVSLPRISVVTQSNKHKAVSFSENAFRTIDETRKNKWFTLTARGWQVAPKIQETVEFLDRNLLHSHTENELIQKAQGRFDLICCRNLLVYFTKPKRNKLIRTLARLLKPNGELVVWGSGGGYSSYR